MRVTFIGATLVLSRLGVAQVAPVPGIPDTTSRARSTHGVSVVDSTRLRSTSARSPADAIAGAVRGASVITVNGTPGVAPVVAIRGAAVHGVNDPLVVIDGTVSRGPLDDLNVDDIERIEVFSGPAATAAYGIGAANGVVSVFTRRGHHLGAPGVRFALRSELSTHLRPRILPINRHHNFQLDASGNFVLDGGGNRVAEADGINDSEYPITYDAPGTLLERRIVLTNHLTVHQTERSGVGGVFASVRHERDPGMLRLLSGFDEKAVRLNVDRSFGKLSVDGGAFILSAGSDLPPDQGSLFSMLRFIEPHGKVDSAFTPCPIADVCYASTLPAGVSGSVPNPLYSIQNSVFDHSRRRIHAGINASLSLTDWLSARAGFTLDRSRARSFSVPSLTSSVETTEDDEDRASIGNVVLTAARTFPRSIRNTTRIGWSRERTFRSSESVSLGSAGTIAASSFELTGITPSLFATTAFEVGLALVVDAAVRRDEPSFFGVGNEATYHRFGVSYRPIDRVGFHVAHGTAGGSVADSMAFDVTIDPAGVLTPPFVHETEAGTMLSLGRVSAGYAFALQRSVSQPMMVPVPTSTGFIMVLRTVGDVTTRSHEMSLGVDVLSRADRGWRVDLVAHGARSRMTRQHVPTFIIDRGATFLVEAGRELNVVVGTRWIRTEAQLLETIATGMLTGTVADYVRNEEGYYVRAADHRTPSERPLAYAQCTFQSGATCMTSTSLFDLGRTTPDVALGLTNSMRWGPLSLNATLTAAVGGIVYNHGRFIDIVRERDFVVDQAAKPVAERKPGTYYRPFGSASMSNEYLVESATHLKLRDLAIDWRLLGRFSVGVVARNLITIGSYDGHDPDVAVPSANLFQRNVDLFQYPPSRTLGAVLRATF